MLTRAQQIRQALREAHESGDYARASELAGDLRRMEMRAGAAWERGAERSAIAARFEALPFAQQADEMLGRRARQIATLGLGSRNAQEEEALLNTPGGAVGNFLPDLAASIPLVKGAQLLQRAAPAFTRAAPGMASIATNAPLAAGYGFATTPGGVGERTQAGLFSGGASAGVEGLTRLAAGGIRGPLAPGSHVSTDARTLMNQGVPVPFWMSRDDKRGAIMRDVVERAKVSPLGRSIIDPAEERAFAEWNRNLSRGASPPRPITDQAGNVLRWEKDPVSKVGSDALVTLRTRFNESYDTLYKGRTIPIDDAFANEWAGVLADTKAYYPGIAADVDGIALKAQHAMVGKSPATRSPGHQGVTPDAVKQSLNVIEDEISGAWAKGDRAKAEALGALKSALLDMRHRGLPPEVQAMSGEINSAYQNFKQLERATSLIAAQKRGMVTPDQMLASLRALDRSPGHSAFARGGVKNQEDILGASRVLGSRLPTVGPGTAEKGWLAALMTPGVGLAALGGELAMGGGLSLLASPMGQKALLGQYRFQPGAARMLQGAAPYAGQGAGILAP